MDIVSGRDEVKKGRRKEMEKERGTRREGDEEKGTLWVENLE